VVGGLEVSRQFLEWRHKTKEDTIGGEEIIFVPELLREKS